MPGISLTDLNNAVTEKYGDFTVDLEDGKVASFTAILRLPKAKREKLTAHGDTYGDIQNTDELMDWCKKFFELRAALPADYKAVVTALKDDPASWLQLFELAGQVEASGEA